MEVISLIGIIAAGLFLWWLNSRLQKANQYDLLKHRLDGLDKYERDLQVKSEQQQRTYVQAENALKQERARWEDQKRKESESLETHVRNVKSDLERIAKEKTIGFPWLAEAYAEYYHLGDMKLAKYLEDKSHPAKSTAEHIRKEIAAKRREAERLMRIYKYQLRYYESLFPWLLDFREIEDDDLLQSGSIGDGTEDSDTEDDPISPYLTTGEQAVLSREEKFQRALDRYWESRKTRWQVGRDYERYVGYLFETNGWDVQYHGIAEGLSDFGRDLIVTSGDRVIIVQCKCWAQHKQIHEKHIFQLFGTTIEYWVTVLGRGSRTQQLLFDDALSRNPVKAMLFTSTTLSESAKQFAAVLGVDYKESIQLVRYPSIKCNASKIYHLPFDQQYDRTKISDTRTEKYVQTVQEAESLGYRRAFRWRGSRGPNQGVQGTPAGTGAPDA